MDLKDVDQKDGAWNSNPVRWDDTNYCWGYWDETWSYWTGGFDTEQQARTACQEYCLKVLGWDTDA
jgi:hypothetical protein